MPYDPYAPPDEEIDKYGATEYGTAAASGALSGGITGSAAGPWGTAVGSVVGAGVGLIGAGQADSQYQKAQEQQLKLDQELFNNKMGYYEQAMTGAAARDAFAQEKLAADVTGAAARANLTPGAELALRQSMQREQGMASAANRMSATQGAAGLVNAGSQRILNEYNMSQALANDAAPSEFTNQALMAAAQSGAQLATMKNSDAWRNKPVAAGPGTGSSSMPLGVSDEAKSKMAEMTSQARGQVQAQKDHEQFAAAVVDPWNGSANNVSYGTAGALTDTQRTGVLDENRKRAEDAAFFGNILDYEPVLQGGMSGSSRQVPGMYTGPVQYDAASGRFVPVGYAASGAGAGAAPAASQDAVSRPPESPGATVAPSVGAEQGAAPRAAPTRSQGPSRASVRLAPAPPVQNVTITPEARVASKQSDPEELFSDFSSFVDLEAETSDATEPEPTPATKEVPNDIYGGGVVQGFIPEKNARKAMVEGFIPSQSMRDSVFGGAPNGDEISFADALRATEDIQAAGQPVQLNVPLKDRTPVQQPARSMGTGKSPTLPPPTTQLAVPLMDRPPVIQAQKAPPTLPPPTTQLNVPIRNREVLGQERPALPPPVDFAADAKAQDQGAYAGPKTVAPSVDPIGPVPLYPEEVKEREQMMKKDAGPAKPREADAKILEKLGIDPSKSPRIEGTSIIINNGVPVFEETGRPIPPELAKMLGLSAAKE